MLLGGDRDLFGSGFDFGFADGFSTDPFVTGKGKRWKDTLGWDKTLDNCSSRGNFPCESRLRVFICSDIHRKAARSARNTWVRLTGEYPGGGG